MISNSMFGSKYLKKAVKLSEVLENKDEEKSSTESESDSESETELTNNLTNFIIDSKPNNSTKSQIIVNNSLSEKAIFGSQLKTGLKLKAYLGEEESAEESQKLLNEMSMKTMKEELKNKLVIKPGFEQQFVIKPFRESKRLRKKFNKEEKSKTSGKEWFNMPSNELTDDTKKDLMALSMRKGWDPKRFYKKNDRKDLPKFFQIGTVVETAADYYHSRVPKKDRKRTLVEELLADAEFKRYSKKKYSEALARNPYYLKMKRRKERQRLGDKPFDNKRKNTKNKKFGKHNNKPVD